MPLGEYDINPGEEVVVEITNTIRTGMWWQIASRW
jgi:hypothetical protein